MSRQVALPALLGMLLIGCGVKPQQRNTISPGPSGSVVWFAGDKQDPVPGIDQGNVICIGSYFVIWSDQPASGPSAASENPQGAKFWASLKDREGRLFQFNGETSDGRTGRVTLNGVNYDLANGSLFLVSADANRFHVKQLRHDFRDMQLVKKEYFQALARTNAEIAEFFAKKGKP